jgi:hypothetical protein
MDAATMALSCVTDLIAALTFLFSRLDARRRNATEPFSVRNALYHLSLVLEAWKFNASWTNHVFDSWAQGQVGDSEIAKLRDAVGIQIASSDEVLAMLNSADGAGNNSHPESWRTLRHLLDLYAPELFAVLQSAFGQRRDMIDELVAELPTLRAAGPEAMQATASRLHSAYEELEKALESLDKYIRDQFPLT